MDWRYMESWMTDLENFVMAATDIIEEGNDLAVTIDLPGFAKKDINLRIIRNVLYIMPRESRQAEALGTVYYRHRPLNTGKRVLLPISFKEEEVKVEDGATYENGIVTLSIPVPKSTNIPKM
jgi:HSP20 family protein